MTETGDKTWGHLEDTEHYGRATAETDFVLVPEAELSDDKYTKCMQAAHCLIYAKSNEKVFQLYSARAAVLMQMRFDGYVGFPGGLVDDGENVVKGLNRELLEEMAIEAADFVQGKDHVFTHYSPARRLCLHFYAVEVDLTTIKSIELNSANAHDHGNESLGTLRVPLYTMGDGYRGFPNFLTNSFVGNARQQLLGTLLHLNLMSVQEIDAALQSKKV